MKGTTHKLAKLGLLGAAISGLIALSNTAAWALTEQQILDKLTEVPVFRIVDEAGNPLPTTTEVEGQEEAVQLNIVFIDVVEAQAYVEQQETEQAGFADSVTIEVVRLSDVYEETAGQPEETNSVVYVPSSQAVNAVSQFTEQTFRGVPLFAALDLESERFLPNSNNQLPMFFSLQDLRSQLATLFEENPDLRESIGFEVIPLEVVLAQMNANDPELDQFLELIEFIPSSRTLQTIRSLAETQSTDE